MIIYSTVVTWGALGCRLDTTYVYNLDLERSILTVGVNANVFFYTLWLKSGCTINSETEAYCIHYSSTCNSEMIIFRLAVTLDALD